MFLKIIGILTAADMVVVAFCYLRDNMIWLYNTQVAFFSVCLIVFGSFIGYSNTVKMQIKNSNVGEDILKKYEDPYNMDEEEEINKEELRRYEQKKLKWHEALLTSFKGGFNIIRISGYVLLIGGFIWLNKNNIFDYLSFLSGVSIIPSVFLIFAIISRKNFKIQT